MFLLINLKLLKQLITPKRTSNNKNQNSKAKKFRLFNHILKQNKKENQNHKLKKNLNQKNQFKNIQLKKNVKK